MFGPARWPMKKIQVHIIYWEHCSF
jgi:hypothetical protein